MTARHLVEITPTELQQMAFDHGGDVEIDTANSRAYLRVGRTTYVAQLMEVTC